MILRKPAVTFISYLVAIVQRVVVSNTIAERNQTRFVKSARESTRGRQITLPEKDAGYAKHGTRTFEIEDRFST